ncbi:unnamed protein product [Meganyctiphanes norvegica]|uniref:Spindle assembly abnormal protein 6 N-terminal domain-containing protein n=1 Tax=Meganyctiphanes norvegica TaxID=48144 RepID=A0AAV2Q666_MEGNR
MMSMGLGNSSGEEVLLDTLLQIRLLPPNSLINAGTIHTYRFRIEHRHNSSGKDILVRLTDDSDPFVLYTCIVREDDYQELRKSQGLLVDFAAFPHKFVELVETCRKEAEKEDPRFLLVLRCVSEEGIGQSSSSITGNSITLEVVEVNMFKHLCHLSLILAPAQTHIKLSYLAQGIKTYKEELTSMKHRASEREQELQQEVQRCRESLGMAQREAQQLRQEKESFMESSAEKETRMKNDEKERILKIRSEADRRLDRERRELESRLNQRIDQLQAKITTSNQQNAELLDKKHRSEGIMKEVRSRLSSTENELDRCRQELSHAKKHNQHLDKDYQNKYTTVRELESRVGQLEAELRNRESTLQFSEQMIETLQQQKQNLESTLNEKLEKLSKREKSIEILYADFQKSLDVVNKLKSKLKAESIQNSTRGAALEKQENVLLEKETLLKEQNNQFQEITIQLKQVQSENSELNKQLKDLQKKIQEQETTLSTNENVISWLNKQLNELEATGVMVRRAPLTEAYLSTKHLLSSEPNSHSLAYKTTNTSPLHHSTPLSNTLFSVRTAHTTGHASTSSLRSNHHFATIPPIPEEISPRNSPGISPTEKENYAQ